MLSIQRLALEDAHVLIEGAAAKAAEIGVPMCISVVGGGLTITVDGAVVGGIGCSSGTPDQDRECAQAGIDRVMAGLG